MPIYKNDNNENILFIHIPKTGGTSIEKALSYYPEAFFNKYKGDFFVTPQHFSSKDYQHLSISVLVDTSFCLVRHPLDRLKSEYKYRVNKSRALYRFFDFSSFVFYLNRVGVSNHCFDNHIRPQVEFLLENTKFYKFEDGIEIALSMISKDFLFSKSINETHEKKSRPIIIKNYFQIDNIVIALYSDDFDKFNYDIDMSGQKMSFFKITSTVLKSFMWAFALKMMKKGF